MNFEKILIAIPARFQSSRLPGKVLSDIGGEPMLKRVLDNCSKVISKDLIFVCTDNQTVLEAVKSWNYKVLMSSDNCTSGSHRIASRIYELISDVWSNVPEVTNKFIRSGNIEKTFVINVQGDQPFFDPNIINQLIKVANDSYDDFDVITPIYKINNDEDIKNPNIVKVLIGNDERVIYFSRSPLPYVRDHEIDNWQKFQDFWGHVGIYGYKASVLANWDNMKLSKIENSEKLEQLRLLDNGYKFKTFKVMGDFFSVDTQDQLEKARNFAQTLKNIKK